MIRGFFLFVINTLILVASTVLVPTQEIQTNGTVKDMVLREDVLLIGTDNGILQVYDYQTKTFVETIALEKVKDFMGDEVPARVFSVDKMDGRYVLLSDSGTGGYANLWIHEDNTTTQILNASDKKAAIKARFIDKEHILLGFLSNEAALIDVKSKKELYRVQLSESKFSDFALNEEKTQAVFSCESGVLSVIDTKTGKLLKELKGLNLDNVYKVDYKKGIISGAGQDRRGSLYTVASGKGETIEGSFLIYATALSPSSKKVAFTMDEQNNITIFNTNTKSKIAELKGQKSTLNTIIFKDENVLFSSSDDNTVMMWNLSK
jgi:WD40 repeat protein